MRPISVLAITAALVLCRDASACDAAAGYRLAGDMRDATRQGPRIPAAPALRLQALSRGAGGADPCANSGMLTIVIDDARAENADAYYLEVASGAFPDLTLPDALITPVDLGDQELGFVFYWTDLVFGQYTLAPIDFVVAVRRISQLGMVSEPGLLRITHPGGTIARAYSSIGSAMYRLTQLAIVLLVPLFGYAYLRQRRRWKERLSEFTSSSSDD